MANLSGIARPYARAAFGLARAENALAAWRVFFQMASEMALDSSVESLLSNPAITSKDLLSLFQEVLGSVLDEKRTNFLKLLAENKRLALLPDMASLFNRYYDALEKVEIVHVVTATESKEEFRQKLAAALKKRLQRDITLTCDVDSSLIGGAVIRIGDRVIDGSIRGKLTRLLEFSLR